MLQLGTEVKTLFLDMDGTLLDLRFDNFFWIEHLPLRYAEIHNLSHTEANDHVAGALAAAEGTMAWYDVDHWSTFFDVDIMSLKEEVDHLIRYREGSHDFLTSIADRSDITAYLVTDAHPRILNHKRNLLDIEEHVAAVFSSHHLGAPKRYPEFWQALSEHLEFEPESTVMIDDSAAVLAQSRAAGIGYQLCIDQPDSGHIRQHDHDFPLIDNLSDLLA